MPVQFQKEMINEGKHGISTMTFMLISYENQSDMSKRAMGNEKPLAFASMMRTATKPYIVFWNDLYPGNVQVAFEQIMNEYKGTDFETVYLHIETKWLPIK
ncbi:MAG: hypothetical protein ABI970_07745 [Chloroflexota bacterium]